MDRKRQPTTVYLDPKIARAAKVKAALTDKSVSDLINEALARKLAEDEESIRIMRQRRREPARDFERVLRELKNDRLI